MRLYDRPAPSRLPLGLQFAGVISALAGAIVACVLLAGAL
jgi:hypothetical protein